MAWTPWFMDRNDSPLNNLDRVNRIIPQGQRDYAGTKEGRTNREENVLQTTIPINPAELQAAMEAASSAPQIMEQRAGIDSLADLAKARIAAHTQLDLSPLMALTDSWTGSKLSQAYRRPMSAEEKGKQDFAYLSDIQKRREDLSDKIRELAKGSIGGNVLIRKNVSEDKLAAETGYKPESRFGAGREGLNADRYMRTFERMPEVKNYKTIMQSANELLLNMDDPNWLADVQARSAIAKPLKPISEYEQKVVSGDPALWSSIERAYGKLLRGDVFSDADRKALKAYGERLGRYASDQIEMLREQHSRDIGPEFGYEPARAKKLIGVGGKKPSLDAAVKPQSNAGGKKKLSFEEFKKLSPEERKKLMGK